MSKTAMTLALEALKSGCRMQAGRLAWIEYDSSLVKQAIKALEEALKQEQGEPVAWRDHVEQRLLTWRQSFVNRSGDQLALDDFMDKESLDDLLEYVLDEYPTPQPKQEQGEPVRDYSCTVCGNKPNSEGLLEHGSGCYTQSTEGGGIEFISDAVKQGRDVNWKDIYEKEKRRSAMWIAKYEKDIGPLERATPQQEQGEPVAVVDSTISGHIDWLCTFFPKQGTKLYTTPQPAQKPLTDEQILRLLSRIDECAVRLPRGLREFARAIEAAHGIKENT